MQDGGAEYRAAEQAYKRLYEAELDRLGGEFEAFSPDKHPSKWEEMSEELQTAYSAAKKEHGGFRFYDFANSDNELVSTYFREFHRSQCQADGGPYPAQSGHRLPHSPTDLIGFEDQVSSRCCECLAQWLGLDRVRWLGRWVHQRESAGAWREHRMKRTSSIWRQVVEEAEQKPMDTTPDFLSTMVGTLSSS